MHYLDSTPKTTGYLTRYQKKARLLAMTALLVVLMFTPTLWQKAQASKVEPDVPASLRSAASPVAMQMAMGGCTGANFSQVTGSPFTTGQTPESVAVGDFNGDGKADLVTAHQASQVRILLGNGSGGFTEATGSPVNTGTGTIPVAVAVGDFNDDGKADLATANPHPSNNVSVLLGNGSGGFTLATGSPVAVVGGPLSIAIGDFNRDGKADLVTANILGNNLTTLLGNGSGGFTTGVTVAAGSLPNFVRVGDFNHDGRDDLVSTNNSTNKVMVLLATAAGNFSAVTPAPDAGINSGPVSIAIGDFNRDDNLDLATANSFSDSVTILSGNGNGSFAAGVTVGVGNNPQSVAVGDFNQDGKPDLAAVNSDQNDVTILAGDGSGGFTQAAGSGLGVGNNPTCLAVGDFNRDGKDDLATSNRSSDDVTILLNSCQFSTCSDTNFAAAPGSPITVGDQPTSMAMGDFNRDGKADLAVVNRESDNVSILLGNAMGGFSNNGTLSSSGNAPTFVAVGDLNRDGKDDLAIANGLSSSVCIWLGSGNGSFGISVVFPIGASTFPSSITIGDFNNDGIPDLATSNNNNSVTILLGLGAGAFSSAPGSPISLGNFPQSAQVGDFNNDGNADLVVVNLNGSSNVNILLGNGSGGFSQPAGSPFPTGGGNSDCVRIGDFNQDGKEDLAVSHINGGGTIGILVGDGMGSFSHAAGSPIFAENRPTSVAIGDFNRDGKEDLAFTNININTQEEYVDILLGNGMAGFSQPVRSRFVAGDDPGSVVAGDFNQDGKDDIATTNFDSDNVAVLLNTCVDNTAPTITASSVSRIASSPSSNSRIATVADAEDAENTLTVEVDGGASATVNSVTVSGISVNAAGFVTANVVAACGATTANFTLRVTDSRGLYTETMLTVTVTPENQPPTISCSANITRSATLGQCSATVSFTATATDNCSGTLTPTCTPASGASFTKGTTTVTCSVSDAAGNSTSCSFTVTVTDTQSPSITCPANITANAATGACTAVVNYSTPTATDNCPGIGSVTCSPSSGSTFQKGTTTVTCNVTDAASNTRNCSFTVTVNDAQNPQLVCPANITKVTAANQCQAVVTYAAPTVSDNCPGVGTPSCSPVSGSTFPKGVTTVSCMVRDASNNQATCAFTVTVLDTQAPAISCPASIITNTLNAGDATVAVSFPAPTAADNCPGATVVCVPPSGAAFPRGVTTVTCTATDVAGNQTSCAFTVKVFDYVIVDDANGRILRFLSTTGEYDYFDCRKNQSLSRVGVVTISNCKTTLVDVGPDAKRPERNVSATASPCTKVGSASVTYNGVTATLTDLNLSNNLGRCP